MKTNVFFKVMVMVAVVMVSGMSAYAGNPTMFVKNDEMSGERLVAKTIFRNEDGLLFRHLRYTYTYDTENRVIAKEAAKWDSVKEAWTPYFKLDVVYDANEVNVSYALWNDRSNAFDKNPAKSTYEWSDGSVVRLLASVK